MPGFLCCGSSRTVASSDTIHLILTYVNSAGADTTATTLSGTTYLLLQHPEVLKRVTQEVRSSFKSVEEIDISSVNKLTYMLAVLNEAMRLYPPVTSLTARIVPRGGAHVLGEYLPEGVSND